MDEENRDRFFAGCATVRRNHSRMGLRSFRRSGGRAVLDPGRRRNSDPFGCGEDAGLFSFHRPEPSLARKQGEDQGCRGGGGCNRHRELCLCVLRQSGTGQSPGQSEGDRRECLLFLYRSKRRRSEADRHPKERQKHRAGCVQSLRCPGGDPGGGGEPRIFGYERHPV